jgi:uncharacterized protein YggE
MKWQIVVPILSLSVLLGGSFWLRGQGVREATPEIRKEKRSINAAGTATIRTDPDAARLYFTVSTMAATLKSARAENGAAFNKVNVALQGLKIPELKLKTADLGVDLVYNHREGEKEPTLQGYRVTHEFTVLLTHADKEKLAENAGRVLDAALENGVNVVRRVVLFKKDETELRRQALSKAVEDAIANAQALGAGAKVQIADTVEIGGTPEYTSPGDYYGRGGSGQVQTAAGAAPGLDETNVVAGQVEITCRVWVTCSY